MNNFPKLLIGSKTYNLNNTCILKSAIIILISLILIWAAFKLISFFSPESMIEIS